MANFVYKYKGKKIQLQDKVSLFDVDDNFTYQKYLEDYAEEYLNLEPIILDDYVEERKDYNIYYSDPKVKEIYVKYDKAIRELYSEFKDSAFEYEKLYFEKGVDPTKDIIELASLYKEVIALLEKEREKKVIGENLVIVLNRMIEKRRYEEKVLAEQESMKRIDEFNNGLIPIGQLCYGDVEKMDNVRLVVKAYRSFRKRMFGKIDDYSMIKNMTLIELDQYLKSMKGKKSIK